MSEREMLALIEEGLKNGRITPHLAAYIAAELLDIAPDDTGYDDWAAMPVRELER